MVKWVKILGVGGDEFLSDSEGHQLWSHGTEMLFVVGIYGDTCLNTRRNRGFRSIYISERLRIRFNLVSVAKKQTALEFIINVDLKSHRRRKQNGRCDELIEKIRARMRNVSGSKITRFKFTLKNPTMNEIRT